DYDGDKQRDVVVENFYHPDMFEFSLRTTKSITEKKWLTVEEPTVRGYSYFLGESFNFFFEQPGDVNGDGYNDACIIKAERNHDIKKNHAPSYTLSFFPGSANGLTTDTLFFYPSYSWKTSIPVGDKSFYPLGDFDGNGGDDVFITQGTG